MAKRCFPRELKRLVESELDPPVLTRHRSLQMKPICAFLAILMLGNLISCKSRSTKDFTFSDTSPPEVSSSLDKQPSVTYESLKLKLDDSPLKRSPVEIEAIRSDVLEVAATKAERPMKIVASLVMSDQHDVERLIFLLEAFNETEMQMDLVTRLPAIGTPRRIVVQFLIRRFESTNDAMGLVQLYNSLSPGADRSDVGAARVRMTIQESGLVAGLDDIKKLERPSERYAAALNTRDVWLPRVREPEVKSGIDEIANSMESPMDYHYKEYISLMVENALSKK